MCDFIQTFLFAGAQNSSRQNQAIFCVATKWKVRELWGEKNGIDTLCQQVSQPGLSNQQERLLGHTQTPSQTRAPNLLQRSSSKNGCKESDRFWTHLMSSTFTHRHTILQTKPCTTVHLLLIYFEHKQGQIQTNSQQCRKTVLQIFHRLLHIHFRFLWNKRCFRQKASLADVVDWRL